VAQRDLFFSFSLCQRGQKGPVQGAPPPPHHPCGRGSWVAVGRGPWSVFCKTADAAGFRSRRCWAGSSREWILARMVLSRLDLTGRGGACPGFHSRRGSKTRRCSTASTATIALPLNLFSDMLEGRGAWPREKKVSSTIKETLFDTGLVDPRSYDKPEIAAAKCKHSDFSTLDDDVWCVAFRRAACEYNLREDHKEVESREIQPRGRYQVSSNSSAKPERIAKTKVRPID